MLGKNTVLFVSFLKKNKQSETHVICSFLRLVSHFYSKMMLSDRLMGGGERGKGWPTRTDNAPLILTWEYKHALYCSIDDVFCNLNW